MLQEVDPERHRRGIDLLERDSRPCQQALPLIDHVAVAVAVSDHVNVSQSSVLKPFGVLQLQHHAPGLRREDWPLEDPKGKPVERVREIRDDVRARVEDLIRREQLA